MKNVYDPALALCMVERAAIELKLSLCNGSMLKGYTAKPIEEINEAEVKHRFAVLEARMSALKEFINS